MTKTVDEARLVAVLEARISDYEKKLKRAVDGTNTRFRSIEGRGKRLESNLTSTFRSAAQSAQLINGPLSGVASRLTTTASVLAGVNPAMVGFGVAIGGATFAAVQALREFSRFEVQQVVTEQVLRATGFAAGKTASDLENLAQSVAQNTLASTNEIREASAIMLTFRSVTGDTFDDAIRLSQDLAQVGFGTAKTAATQLGKALEDPVNGMSALRRVGVSFSVAQQQVIKDLVETGQTAAAQRVLLDALRSQVGGAGAAAANGTLAGAYDALSQSTQNLLVQWGRQIAEALNLKAAISGVASVLDDLNKATVGGSLDQQLVAINARIEEVKSLAPVIARLERGQRVAGLESLISRRDAILAQMLAENEERAAAAAAARSEQLTIANERAQGVVSSLEKELSLAGKTAIEKRKINELRKAGVTAESEIGQQIIKNLDAIAKAEAALKESRSGSGSSAFARTERQLTERIQLLNAESQALLARNPLIEDFGRSASFAEVRQRLLNAALRDGREITPELDVRITSLATAYATAASAAQRAEQSTEDLRQAAQSLKSSAESAVGDLIKDLRSGVSAGEAFSKALNRIADTLIDIATRNLFGSAFNGLLGGLSFGAPQAAGVGAAVLHSGGRVSGAERSRSVPAAAFAGAPRFHRGGIAGLASDEVPAILQRGEIVVPRGSATGSAPGNSVQVNVINNSGSEVTETRRSSGQSEIVDLVIGAANDGIASGRMDSSMRARFNARPMTRQR